MQLSDELKKKLAALSSDFSTQLPERFRELQKALTDLHSHADIQGMMDLRLMVHKLAGSAATFGHEQLSVRAKEFEVYLDDLIRSEHVPSDVQLEKIEGYIDYLKGESDFEGTLEEIDEAEENGTTTEPGADKTPAELSEETVREICLYGFYGERLKDISRHLGFYGYTVIEIDDLSFVRGQLEEGRRRILFVDTEVLEKGHELRRMKDAYSGQLAIVFVSDDDTFDLRLRAIRSGGDAFFVRPLDMGRVIDKLDGFVNKKETEPIHVLIVDDDPEQVAYYALILQQAGMITSVASDPMKVLSILVESRPDLILMDIYMPGCSGLELTKLLRQHEAFITIPIIFLSFENDRERQMRAIGQGGDDFIIKPIKPDYLTSIVRLRAQRNRNLRYFMERDSLTGLLNHSNLKEQLAREIIRAERSETAVSFAMIDADHFKNVNDTYGHLMGDRVLKSLARMLQDRLRRTDIIGRYGGEEFGVILINTKPEDARQIMEEIRENFGRVRHHAENEGFSVTFSCGIASYPALKEPEDISSAADEALYQAKEMGRNQVVVYSPPKRRYRSRTRHA